MNMTVRRIILTYIENPCLGLEYVKKITLYSLLVSHGIRIDTALIISSSNYTVYLDGYAQKYLYAHDKSLRGYLYKILCKGKTYPGVKLYPRNYEEYIINTQNGTKTLVLKGKPIQSKPPLTDNYVITIFNTMIKNKNTYDHLFTINAHNELSLINVAHYLLDIWLGSWIRRKGRIDWFEPAR